MLELLRQDNEELSEKLEKIRELVNDSSAHIKSLKCQIEQAFDKKNSLKQKCDEKMTQQRTSYNKVLGNISMLNESIRINYDTFHQLHLNLKTFKRECLNKKHETTQLHDRYKMILKQRLSQHHNLVNKWKQLKEFETKQYNKIVQLMKQNESYKEMVREKQKECEQFNEKVLQEIIRNKHLRTKIDALKLQSHPLNEEIKKELQHLKKAVKESQFKYAQMVNAKTMEDLKYQESKIEKMQKSISDMTEYQLSYEQKCAMRAKTIEEKKSTLEQLKRELLELKKHKLLNREFDKDKQPEASINNNNLKI
ncbi:putative surface protein [Reticulomyxa filosa]|uniref:Putative surface protein n=1 Tax=Reticulomyxa filosa TaxID=46433 RepID=X6NVH2_RETFI|nr:putative surface protein [Reticulomyxa filosa]|eukprot:ETO29809.1 putative surface protein [Reticulomyxa filosa]